MTEPPECHLQHNYIGQWLIYGQVDLAKTHQYDFQHGRLVRKPIRTIPESLSMDMGNNLEDPYELGRTIDS
jgi:hypothetical protein